MSTIFDYLRLHVPILDIVNEYVRLRPAGSYWKGSCPFHSETDASFTVSPDKAIFYCFGCQAGGDVIGFIAKKENVSQIEAATFIIEQRGLSVPKEIVSTITHAHTSSERSSALAACNAFADWIHKQFLESTVAQAYCRQRGITIEHALLFGVGYISGGTASINRCMKAMHSQGVLVKELMTLGIIQESKSALYSPFEERIIFPIRDSLGHICGFGGRIFRQGDDRPKYYNSKESEVFAKGKIIFGLDRAKQSIQQQRKVFLVEGYIDCLMMASYGYTNTVATLGTACTIDHLKLLARYADTIYMLYDGDAAGKKAVMRLTQLCWEVNLELQVVTLPEKEDPASFLSAGHDLQPLVTTAQSIFSFFIKAQTDNFMEKSLSEKLSKIDEIIELIVKITDPLKQEILLQQAGTTTGIPMTILYDRIKKQAKRNFTKSNSSTMLSRSGDHSLIAKETHDKDIKISSIERIEEHIFALLINNMRKDDSIILEPELIPYFSDRIRKYMTLFMTFAQKQAHSGLLLSSFLDLVDQEDREWILRISLLYGQSVQRGLLFQQLIEQFCKHHWKYIIQDLKEKMQKAHEVQDAHQLNRLFSLFSSLKQGIQSRGLI